MTAPAATRSRPVRAGTGRPLLTAAVIGASGYVGGELLRLLLDHPRVRLTSAVSHRLAGRRVDGPHPHLRGRGELTFCPPDRFTGADVTFLAVRHGQAARLMPALVESCALVIDLSADFRLPAGHYQHRHGEPHPAPQLLTGFVPGLPELYRGAVRTADRISGPGCMATAAILALHPLATERLVEPEVTVDARTGSSGSGRADPSAGSAHPERASAWRVFAPAGHRHEPEIAQATGLRVGMTATAVPAVRGVQTLCQGRLREGVDEPAVRAAYRRVYADEPFVRVVARRRGHHRYPEPAILCGSNFCDVGFAVAGRRVVAIAALDNLVKGAAGNAVQCLNIRLGWPEHSGLEFPGLHPV